MGDMADYYEDREDPLDDGKFYDRPRSRRMTYPQKGTTVATTPKKLTAKQKVRKIEAELDGNLTLQATLKAEEIRLRHDLKLADVPPEPPATAGDMFRVVIRFDPQGKNYNYLLSRIGDGRWFTTGSSPDQKVFASWEALCEWINSTAWHSHVERLQVTGKTSYITEYSEPPF